jgi:uncharacterized membrane protein
MQPSRLRDRLRSSLWFVPALFGIAAVVLAFVLVRVDRGLDNSTLVGFGGGPESARSVLSTVAASTITFAGLVFSITVLALQLASGQFSPRVLRTFLRDRSSKVTLGVTIGTFTFSLLVLQSVRSEGSPGGVFVPSIAVSASLLFAVVAVASFIQYIHHISQSIQASRILDAVAGETIQAIARLDDREPGAPPPSGLTWAAEVTADRDGVVVGVDERELTRLASSKGCELTVVPRVGDPVVDGMPLLRSSVGLDEEATERAREAIDIAPERTMQQDVAFGLRQLVDIGDRALSPGVNDPTTAVQAIDFIHGLLGRLARREIPSPFRDVDGTLALILARPGWPDYVALACDELRHSGREQIQVQRRLRAMLLDLLEIAPPDRRQPLVEQLQLLDEYLPRGFQGAEIARARTPSAQGQGPA